MVDEQYYMSDTNFSEDRLLKYVGLLHKHLSEDVPPSYLTDFHESLLEKTQNTWLVLTTDYNPLLRDDGSKSPLVFGFEATTNDIIRDAISKLRRLENEALGQPDRQYHKYFFKFKPEDGEEIHFTIIGYESLNLHPSETESIPSFSNLHYTVINLSQEQAEQISKTVYYD